jgi:hypothetical protein
MNPRAERPVTSGVSSRSLSGGSPRRLCFDRGKWVLEVVRHVNIGHDLVRPTTECLSGHRLINSYFKSNPDQESLGRGALKLMQMSSGDARSYSAIGAEWVSSSVPPGRPDPGDRGDGGPSLETQVAELHMRVTALVALQEGLLVRLARLETRVLEGGLPESSQRREGAEWIGPARAQAGRATRARAEPVAAKAPPEDELQADSADTAEPEPRTAPSLAPAPAEALPAAPAPVPAVAAPAPRARPRAELELPPLAELGKCISLLVGNDMSVEGGPVLEVSSELANCYAAKIEDDSGEQLGLILMDLRATVFLGGSLMMQPQEQLEQQYASAVPEQDSIAASAEICNALSGAINAAQTRYHVRTSGLDKFNLARHPWASSALTRRDLADSFGGRVAVLAIPGSS